MRAKILRLLRQNDTISGEEMSRLLGVSRAAVAKHIQALRREGYRIEAAPHRGYSFLEAADTLSAGEISHFLGEGSMWRLKYLPLADSTSNVLRALAEAGEAEGLAVIADEQTDGRGRLGRKWHSPAGSGLWFSFLLHPALLPQEAHKATLLAAVAMTETLQDQGIPCYIKWPNDVMSQGKKLCGILCEMRCSIEKVDWLIVGLGLNINNQAFPPELAETAISLRQISGRKENRALLLAALLRKLEQNYLLLRQEGFSPIREKWRGLAEGMSKTVEVRTARDCVSGLALDIDDDGFLLLRAEDGSVSRITSGDLFMHQ